MLTIERLVTRCTSATRKCKWIADFSARAVGDGSGGRRDVLSRALRCDVWYSLKALTGDFVIMDFAQLWT
jgi:hypothetical protein